MFSLRLLPSAAMASRRNAAARKMRKTLFIFKLNLNLLEMGIVWKGRLKNEWLCLWFRSPFYLTRANAETFAGWPGFLSFLFFLLNGLISLQVRIKQTIIYFTFPGNARFHREPKLWWNVSIKSIPSLSLNWKSWAR